MPDKGLERKPSRRRPRAAFVMIAVTAAACLAAIAFRTPLCARYWAWRLMRATTAAESSAYLAALCNAGDSGRWGINVLLTSNDAAARQYGVLVLQHVKTPWARQRLLDLLTDQDPSVQELAALGLAVRGDDAVIPTLKWQYETGDAALAASACRAFEHLGTPEAVAALYEMAFQPADAVRRAALVDTLSGIGTAECVPALLELLTDERACDVPSRRESPPAGVVDRLRAAGYVVASTSAPATGATPRTVAERAATALARITAVNAPYSSDATEGERAAARQKWTAWWAARPPER